MNNIIAIDCQGEGILLERTEPFIKVARELNDFLHTLPLDNQEHNKLVDLIIQNVTAGEKGAFLQGFDMGIEFASWAKEKADVKKDTSPRIIPLKDTTSRWK